jgi:uncharacterized protein (TIGR02217 family)
VSSFIEVEFPRLLALMSTGGPGFFTTINAGFSGYEQRNQNWAQSRAQYAVSFEHKPLALWQAFEAMFYAAKGMANGFRLWDPGDNNGVGQYQATGNSSTKIFQMQKTYFFPISQYEVVRPVQKPITSLIQNYTGQFLTDTVVVYLNGVAQPHNPGYVAGGGAAYTLDATTGVITFATAPGAGVIITADYQYHIPVRFDFYSSSSSTISSTEGPLQKTYETGVNAPGGVLVTVSGINLVELKIPPGQAS